MAKIRLLNRDDATLNVHKSKRKAKADGVEHLAQIDTRTYFPGLDGDMTLFEVTKYPPSDATDSHAHEVDEIMYVLEGELIVGQRHYGPGSAIYIPANTLYGFSFGENGVRYLNFRPKADESYISKSDFMEMRRARVGESVDH